MRGVTEFGQVVPKGATNVARLVAIIEDPANGLPEQAVTTLRMRLEVITGFDGQIGKLDAEIRQRAKENEAARRLMTSPGISQPYPLRAKPDLQRTPLLQGGIASAPVRREVGRG